MHAGPFTKLILEIGLYRVAHVAGYKSYPLKDYLTSTNCYTARTGKLNDQNLLARASQLFGQVGKGQTTKKTKASMESVYAQTIRVPRFTWCSACEWASSTVVTATLALEAALGGGQEVRRDATAPHAYASYIQIGPSNSTH
ncbi:hypothetical protein Y032_0180g785 [Ancylostoma ceylanicum]|uniref:Uncharacterized protein n=1 Tax=Ancylostoma ceylanicum TaxID=53326 RepID=A0A016STG4_9BILA|nr:hypothetical protein Y032_0180g785 [Ancylostoma ceylanicum]